jgi:hypothetical protein
MKKIAQVFSLVIISLAFTSCEGLLDNCKVCSLNTYEDGALILSQSEAEYCDAELISIQATPAQTNGNLVIKWECK